MEGCAAAFYLYNPLMTSYLFPFFLAAVLLSSLFNLEQQGETPRALASSPSFGIEIHLKDLPGGIERRRLRWNDVNVVSRQSNHFVASNALSFFVFFCRLLLYFMDFFLFSFQLLCSQRLGVEIHLGAMERPTQGNCWVIYRESDSSVLYISW